MTNEPNLDLFQIRKQYNAMLIDQADKLNARYDELFATREVIDAESEALDDYTHRQDERREISKEASSLLKQVSGIVFGLKCYVPATPEIVELMQNEYPEWLEVVIQDGSIRHPVAAALEESAIVEAEAEAVVEDAVEDTCCGKWAVHDPFKVVSCSCARPAVVDTAAIDEFIDDYDALFGQKLAA